MRKSKYILLSILLFLIFSFIGELYVWHINDFENQFTNVSFFKPNGVSQSEMVLDITEAAKQSNIEFFVIDRKYDSALSERVDIYSNSDIADELAGQVDISQGNYKSIFLGETIVDILKFNKIPDVNSVENYYLLGESDDMVKFKQLTVDKYGGHFPRSGTENDDIQSYIIFVWIIALSLILLLTQYEIIFLRKEATLRLLSGDRLGMIILKHIITDLIVYSVLFCSIWAFFCKVTIAEYCSNITVSAYIVFLGINSLLYIRIRATDFRRNLSFGIREKKLLTTSYLFKIISISIIAIIMSGNFAMISLGVETYSQRNFYKNNEDFSFVMLSTYSENDNGELEIENNFNFYKRMLSANKTLALVHLAEISNKSSILYADKGALQYLTTQLRVENQFEKDCVYFLIPEKYKHEPNIENETYDMWNNFCEDSEQYNTIYYNSRSPVISVTNQGSFSSHNEKNPIVIFNNTDGDNVSANVGAFMLTNSILFKTDNNEVREYISSLDVDKNNTIYYCTNAYIAYTQYWQLYQRGLIIGFVLFILLLFVEITVIRTIICYEYKVNAVELSIKKVMGYTVLQRYRKILLLTIVAGVICVIAVIIILMLFPMTNLFFAIIGCVLSIVLEFFVIIFYIHKIENSQITRILKGGVL